MNSALDIRLAAPQQANVIAEMLAHLADELGDAKVVE